MSKFNLVSLLRGRKLSGAKNAPWKLCTEHTLMPTRQCFNTLPILSRQTLIVWQLSSLPLRIDSSASLSVSSQALWGFPIVVLSSDLMAPISKLGIRESFLPPREWMHLGNCFLLHLPWWMQKTTTIGYGCLNFSAVFLNNPHPSSLNLRYRLK